MRHLAARSARTRLIAAAIAASLLAAAAAGPAVAAGPDRGAVSGPLAGEPVGERVTLEGVVRMVIADDFVRGRSSTSYGLQTTPDGHVRLVVPEGRVPDLAGRRALVTGTVLPGGAVRVHDAVPMAGDDGGTGDAAGGPAARAGATAEAAYGWEGPAVRHVAVVIATYSDEPTARGTAEDVAQAMTDAEVSVKQFFETASRGEVSVTATVLGPWKLKLDSCDAFDLFFDTAAAVTAQADVEGINLAQFDHVLMWVPHPCQDWLALGEAPGQFILMSAGYPDEVSRLDEFVNVAAHEMGHNMGLLHANSLVCVDDELEFAQLTDECGTLVYGDPFSTMGGDQGVPISGQPRHWISPLYDAAELAHLGWLAADEEQVVTADGDYELMPAYGAADGVRLLRIKRDIAPIGEDPSMHYPLRSGWLTIELRNDPPDGAFDNLVPGSPSTEGVIIRYVEDGYDPIGWGFLPALGSTYLVDTVPETWADDLLGVGIHDAPLTVGGTFTDSVTGTTVTLTSLDEAGATVAVDLGPGQPPATPEIAAPVITEAAADDGAATVTWEASSTSDTHPVTAYTVRSYPGAQWCVAFPDGNHPQGELSCRVSGLVNGTTYRFTVTSSTVGGYWQMSLPSDPVTPVGPPSARIVPLALYRASQAITVEWRGTDDGEPVDSFDVRYRAAKFNGGFGSHTTWRTDTTDESGSFTGRPGRTYCFSARATNEGVTGPWSSESCAVAPMDDRSLKAGSTWKDVTGPSLYRQTGLRSSKLGAVASKANLQARRVALVATTCSGCGSVKVYWNGTLKKTVKLTSSTKKHRVVIPVLSFPGVKTGDLRLVVGTSGKRVQLDGVLVSRK